MKDLHEFRPERWNEITPGRLQQPLPFGFGGRICPGKKIALSEIKVLLCGILMKYEVRLRIENEELLLKSGIGIGIKEGTGNLKFNKI